jgi:hypothetical protein
MRKCGFFSIVICLAFFVDSTFCQAKTGQSSFEQKLLKADGHSVFQLDFSNDFIACVGQEQLNPNNRNLPEIQSDGIIKFVHLSDGQMLSYPVIDYFPTSKGTFEILIRYKNVGNKTLGLQHVFSLYKSDLERIYLRFYDMKFHYLVRNGAPITNQTISYNEKLNNSAWAHVVMQWDFTQAENGMVQLYLNGQKICQRDNIKVSPIELSEQSKLFIGSWTDGNLRLSNFDIASVRISDILRYEGQSVKDIDQNIRSQRFELTGKKIDALLADEKLSLYASERKLLKELKKQTAQFYGDYQNAVDETAADKLFSSVEAVSKRVEAVDKSAQGREWFELNNEKGLMRFKTRDNDFAIFTESAMVKIKEDKVGYTPSAQKDIELFSARNEYEPFQLIVAPLKTGETQIKIKASELVLNGAGDVIPADNIELLRVRSIGSQFPDPLLAVTESESIELCENGVFWVNVYVPKESKAGLYKGTIRITADNKHSIEVPYTLNVWNFTLPIKPALKTAFGYSPEYVAAWTPGMANKDIDELSDEYIRYMLRHRTSPKSYMRFRVEMAVDAKDRAKKQGGSIVESQSAALPSNINLFHPRQVLKKDGAIVLDFSEFDKMVEKYLPLGLSAFVAGNRYWDAQNQSRRTLTAGKDVKKLKHKLWVYDEQAGKERILYLDVLSDEYVKAMQSIFRQWQEHLEQKGWLDMAYGYIMDEPEPYMFEFLSEVYGIAGKAAPKIPLMVTYAPEEKIKNVDIWCPMFDRCPVPLIQQTLKTDKEMWYYVCINPHQPYGNFFLSQDSIDHRVLFWQTYKYGGKGFLYWEINFWFSENPLDGIKGVTFSSTSDGSLLYPGPDGPIGSLRYEIIREGIEDYDYLVLLRKALISGRLSQSDKVKAEKLLEVPEELVVSPREFNRNPEVLLNLRRSIGEILSH